MARAPYPPEFRPRMIELARSGRTPEELAREFEPSAQTIRNWVAQADLDEGRRSDGLTTEERDELRKLRRENRRFREEREILKKPRPGSPRRPTRTPPSVRVRRSSPGRVRSRHDVPHAGRLRQRILRVAHTTTVGESATGRAARRAHPIDPRAIPRNIRSAPRSRGTGRREHPYRSQIGRAHV